MNPVTRRELLLMAGGAWAAGGVLPGCKRTEGGGGAPAPGGMVASSQRVATEAGLSILRAGGNAADAAVAVAAALNVSEPTSTGLGGDCFALYFDAAARAVTALNGSGRAPAALTLELLRAQQLDKLPPFHAHTITIPGA